VVLVEDPLLVPVVLVEDPEVVPLVLLEDPEAVPLVLVEDPELVPLVPLEDPVLVPLVLLGVPVLTVVDAAVAFVEAFAVLAPLHAATIGSRTRLAAPCRKIVQFQAFPM
jgi:hypothetical protein